ncbi:MAG: hypothetical protein J7497_15770 [Chitinophagaceae bacterium]|nr:hypothetical protein [Chitinophagaceae bacterium]
MPNFDLKKITATKGKQLFYQLTIDDNPDYSDAETEEEKNERKTGVLDEYEAGLEKRYQKDLKMIYAYMDRVSNNLAVSGQKYHELDRPSGDRVKDFEFKHGDLRVYGFKHDSGKIITVGGYKNSQKADIQRLRSLKQQYLDSLK